MQPPTVFTLNLKFLKSLFALLFSSLLFSQATVPIRLSWNTQVGCQNFSTVTDRDETTIFVADIIDGSCLRIGENSTVSYSLKGNLGTNANTKWTAVGGKITTRSATSVTINWGQAREGNLSFYLVSRSQKLRKSFCIEILKGPRAFFYGIDIDRKAPIYACATVPFQFNNASTDNGGTAIISNYWKFISLENGTIEYSNSLNPVYTFLHPGSYMVELTVTNSCNCKSTFRRVVEVKDSGLIINYPSVVCENNIGSYSIKGGIENYCGGGYVWSVVGGTMMNDPTDPTIKVKWNNVDASGFGTVTFTPAECSIPCALPVSIKVPVVKQIGNITGALVVCKGQQTMYTLPEWPTTNFLWTVDDNAATVVPSDQRNAVFITPLQAGTITLRATYQNTLLHCTGTATMTITVKETISFVGNTSLCLNQGGTYSTVGGIAVNWTLKRPNGTVVATLPNSTTFTYPSFGLQGSYELLASGPTICDNQNLTISVNPPLANPIIDNPKLTVCPFEPTVYKILTPQFPTAQYQWEVTNGVFVGTTQGFEVTVKFSAPGTIRVKRVNSLCSTPWTTHNINLQAIDAQLSDRPTNEPATAMAACQSTYKTYKAVNVIPANSLYNDPESTYEWSILPPSAGSIQSGQNTNTVSVLWNNVPNNAPFINVQLVCSIKKCTLTRNAVSVVTVYASPSFTVTAPNSVCSGVGISFALTPTLPVGSSVFWTFSDGSTLTAPGNVPTPAKIFYNGGNANVNYTATATFSNAFGCPGNYTSTKSFAVTPGPAISVAANGGTGFCPASAINTTLTPSFNAGTVITWYKNNTIIAGPTSSNAPLVLNSSSGYGEYYCIAAAAGCLNRSNSIFITSSCVAPSCTISPAPQLTIVNNGVFNNNCGTLSLTGTAASNPLNTRFAIQGPGLSLNSGITTGAAPNNFSTPIYIAGVYDCTFSAQYNAACTFATNLQETVPYIANLTTTVVCNSNNTFNVTLLNSSSVMSQTTGLVYTYFYREIGSSLWLGPVLPAAGSANAVLNNLPQGNYEFRQRLEGTLNGTTYPACEKIITRNLIGFGNQSIVFTQPNCYNSVVAFSTSNPQPGWTYLWTFVELDESTNSQPAPVRVFNTVSEGTNVSVSVLITNIYGCSIFRTTVVNVPLRCFKSDNSSVPGNAIVCKGQSVIVKYEPASSLSECPPDQYILMDNTTQKAVSTSNSFAVTTPGSYWIKVIKINNNDTECVWNTTNRISPSFVNPPSLKLTVPTFVCGNENVNCAVETDPPASVIINWLVDNVPQPAFDNLTNISLSNYAPGTYTIKVVVTNFQSGCSITDSRTTTVLLAPTDLTLNPPTLIDCNSYEINLTANCSQTGTYLWSNGMSGASITVYSGGLYQVTFTNEGGCQMTEQIVVPRKPDHYMWIYPQGAYQLCAESPGSLIGPNQQFFAWEWQFYNSAMLSGSNSKPQPYFPAQDGSYNLILDSGLCPVQSPEILVELVPCVSCLKEHTIQSIVAQTTPFCSYVMNVQLVGAAGESGVNLTFISPSNQVIVNPSVFVPGSSANVYALTVIPINGFTGGTVTIQAVSVLSNGEKCYYNITFTLPPCFAVISRTVPNQVGANATDGSLILFPNPAQKQVTIQFESLKSNATIAIYDLTGRLVVSHDATTLKGEWLVDVNALPEALYVVIMKENDQIIMQRKLQITR